MKIKKSSLPVYDIQENGLISSSDWADGRLIPAIVLNNLNTGNELKDLLNLHSTSEEQGDVITQWATPLSQFFKPKSWILLVSFTKPKNFSFYIEFSLEKYPALLDSIFQSRGLYIMYGFLGDKITKRRTQDIILMEIPDLQQDNRWNKTLREILKTRMKKQNVPKKQVSNEVEKQIRKMRDLIQFRR